EEMIHNLLKKRIAAKTICITFDDGYADNYKYALPILEKYGCPATFFITSSMIANQELYWWDQLQSIILCQYQLPSSLSIDVNGTLVEHHFDNLGLLSEADWNDTQAWCFEKESESQRCQLFKTLWSRLKSLSLSDQQKVLQQLKKWSALPTYDDKDYQLMTLDNLHYISQHPLFNLGIHTHTHTSLDLWEESIQYQEINACKVFLESNQLSSLPSISYPYGDYNECTIAVTKAQNIISGFTTNEQAVTNKTNPLSIGRFQVKNWNAPVFQKHLQHWLKS
ncbi:MAG: polysaccharide deacetylase family protein, partial [Flavobacterium sp.]